MTSGNGLLTRQEVIELLRGGFDYSRRADDFSPAGEYFWYRKRQAVLSLLDQHFAAIPRRADGPWRMVDLGCGDGTDLYLIRDHIVRLNAGVRVSVVGAEGDTNAIRLCGLKRTYYGDTESDFVACDLSRPHLPFRDAGFDLVYCSEVVEHLLAPEVLLAEARRILTPGGYLMLTTPNEPNLLQRSYWNARRRSANRDHARKGMDAATGQHAPVLMGHVSTKPLAEWERLLVELGFGLIDFRRGALVYTLPGSWQGELLTGLRLCAEAILDIFPKALVRNFSDQLIGLYRKPAVNTADPNPDSR